jgi:hypothetical protein
MTDERGNRKKDNRGDWWKPGGPTPERAPNVEKAIAVNAIPCRKAPPKSFLGGYV